MNNVRFIAVIFLLGILLGLFVFVTIDDFNAETRNYISSANDAVDQRLSALYAEINNLPRGAGNDILFLSKLASINNFADSSFKNSPSKIEAEKDLVEFLAQNRFYQNLAIISSDGSEMLGVVQGDNGEIKNIENPNENYSGHNYFEITKNLEKNEVYISDITSSLDNFPVMHYASPIIDDSENLKGILLLTVNVNYFLEDIRNFSRPGEKLYLIGSDGRYLANSDKNKEFINGGGKDNFKTDFRGIAEKILPISDNRSLENKEYLYDFRYIRPRLSSFEIFKASEKMGSLPDNNFYWVLVSVSERQNDNFVLNEFKKQRIIFLSASIILIAAVGFLACLSQHQSKKRTGKIKS